MKLTTKDMLSAALFAALTIVGAKVNFLLPDMPITLQPIIVILSGCLIGRKAAFLSQVVYVMMGLIGLPVFAKPDAGPSYVLQPSFGYLVGFIAAAYIIGLIIEKSSKKPTMVFIGAGMAGLFIIYLSGIIYFYILMNTYVARHISFIYAVTMMVPFIVKDITLGIAVSFISSQVYHRVKLQK